MDRQEILVHITARSRRVDDERLRSLAENLETFEAAAMTLVWGADDGEEVLILSSDSTNSDFFENSIAITQAVQETQVEQEQRASTGFQDEPKLPTVKNPISPNATRVVRTQITNRYQYLAPKNPNVPYRNPFYKLPASRRAVQVLRTPEPPRPQTAPAGSSGIIQVPNTDVAVRKRAGSEASSFGSLQSTVPDSQPTTIEVANVRNTLPQWLHVKSRPHNNHSKPPPFKRRRIASSSDIEVSDITMEDIASRLDASQEERTEATIGGDVTRDRSLQLESPPVPPASAPSLDTISSTLSPSQPLALRLSQARISRSPQPSPSPIDLTSDLSPTITKGKETAQSRDGSPVSTQYGSWPASNHISRPMPSAPSTYYGSLPTSRWFNMTTQLDPSTKYRSLPLSCFSKLPASVSDHLPTSSIEDLPSHIEPPQAPMSLDPFETHITEPLAGIVTRLPFENFFRPVFVARDIHVLERGHWSLRVRIASSEVVAAARKDPTIEDLFAARAKQLAGTTTVERMQKFQQLRTTVADDDDWGLSEKRTDVWTEDEFIKFWEHLTDLIKDGKAGWGIRVARDWGEDAVTPGRSTQTAYARIRIFSWGELVGHVYLVLWLFSDKKSSYVPMEWIAADDTVVIRMSGNRNRGGKLGPWVYKGPSGEHGRWGVRDKPA